MVMEGMKGEKGKKSGGLVWGELVTEGMKGEKGKKRGVWYGEGG